MFNHLDPVLVYAWVGIGLELLAFRRLFKRWVIRRSCFLGGIERRCSTISSAAGKRDSLVPTSWDARRWTTGSACCRYCEPINKRRVRSSSLRATFKIL